MREDLSDEDMNRLDGVRKQIWAAGYSGFFLGGAWGLGNCIIYRASVFLGLPASEDVKFLQGPDALWCSPVNYVCAFRATLLPDVAFEIWLTRCTTP